MWKILSSVVETDQCLKSYCWKTVTDMQVTISKGKLAKIDIVLPGVLLRPASALISSTQWGKKLSTIITVLNAQPQGTHASVYH